MNPVPQTSNHHMESWIRAQEGHLGTVKGLGSKCWCPLWLTFLFAQTPQPVTRALAPSPNPSIWPRIKFASSSPEAWLLLGSPCIPCTRFLIKTIN